MNPRDVVAFITADPAATGLFTDFDGTLSPIVAEPAGAYPVEGAVEALHELAGVLAVVGVVSGRPASFLSDRLGLGSDPGRLHAYGLHGLEHTTGGAVETADAVLGWQGTIERARDEVLSFLPEDVDLEDKLFGFTIHWRRASDPSRAEGLARDLAGRVAEKHGLVVRAGRRSLEVVPPVGIDKGSVLVEWAGRLATRLEPSGSRPRLVFFGDDVGDLLGFEALGTLSEQGRASVMRVAVASPEAPDELVAVADMALDDPRQVRDVLREAAGQLGSG